VLPWPSNFNALAYALSGNGTVGPQGQPLRSGQLAVLGAGESVVLRADAVQDSRTNAFDVFLLGGVPLGEPVAAYGPFVMSSKAELIEAFEDYQAGRFGAIPADAIQPHRI